MFSQNTSVAHPVVIAAEGLPPQAEPRSTVQTGGHLLRHCNSAVAGIDYLQNCTGFMVPAKSETRTSERKTWLVAIQGQIECAAMGEVCLWPELMAACWVTYSYFVCVKQSTGELLELTWAVLIASSDI